MSAAITAASVTAAKVQTFRDHLSADQHVAAVFEGVENARVIADARRRVGIHPQNARVGKKAHHFFGDRFVPIPNSRIVLASACRADVR